MRNPDSKLGLKIEFIIGFMNIIFVIFNAYMTFIVTPKQIEDEFIDRWQLNTAIYEAIVQNNGLTRDELYRKMMDKYPKETAESIAAKISSNLLELSLAKIIEENAKGELVQAPTMREFMEYKKLPSYQEDIVIDKVKRIAFNDCYKYTVKEIYDKIHQDINMDFDHFEMIVYSHVRYPQVPPFIYDGYIINDEGKVCHLASKKNNK